VGAFDDRDVSTFLEAGFSKDRVLEVVLVVAASTITNYADSATQPTLEEMFKEHTWNA
jgi:alkylhydroperoxidase family enzyme